MPTSSIRSTMKLRPRAIPPIRAPLCVMLLASGCLAAPPINQRALPFIEAGDHTGALEVFEEGRSEFGWKNEVLYHLERGMLLHYAGRWKESNESFEIAKRAAELHYTKSITAEAATFLWNDNARPYYGENFERALIHVFAALNHQQLGDYEGALVEIRQLNFLLRTLIVDDGQDNGYEDDAFAHYLAAMLFEHEGELDEAYVAYKKAIDAYAEYGPLYGVSTPPGLYVDAARLTERLGSWATSDFRSRYGEMEVEPLREGAGRVNVLHYNGRAPVKIDTFIDIAFGDGWVYVNKIDVEGEAERQVAEASAFAASILATHNVRVAFPEYRTVPRVIRRMAVHAEGRTVRSQLVEDVGAIARKDLADRIARIRAKAIARAVVKFALAKAAEAAAVDAGGEDHGEFSGRAFRVGASLFNTLSERADKRGWFTVPDEISMSALELEAGDHVLAVEYLDEWGGTVAQEEVPVRVEPGRRSFVLLRTVQ